MRRVVYSPAARKDLDGIWDYTVTRWGEAQAERYLGMIGKACANLVSYEIHSRAIDDVRPGYRKMLAGSHIVYLRLLDSGDVMVVRVLHQRMDVEGKL